MTNYEILILVLFSLVIVAFIGYKITTDSIIRDQEKQIAKLRTETFRLQAKLRNRPNVKTIEIYDHSIEPENIPTFGDI